MKIICFMVYIRFHRFNSVCIYIYIEENDEIIVTPNNHLFLLRQYHE
jgi:hypothetical protein